MKRIKTLFTDVILVEPTIYRDHRGFFKESFNEKVWEKQKIQYQFIQDNISESSDPGTIRGLHFQLNPKAQTKLVQVVKGVIYDVIVDLRKGSPTYKKWQSFILSEYNHRQLLVPKGFAHGFCTLVPNSMVMYKVDEYYAPEYDSGINWKDEELGIAWPFNNPILSEKDKHLPFVNEEQYNFTFEEKKI
ncbi:dTDP-4-dehydrorhamnose 3,5-epimerase [Bacillus cereus group sp. BfR-BA-01380]|uniref:dTDP-4-dehydrorhamnose 3,5-epimerase n=1 Tax=Bacillus cereus group sp. BfR-BA-01380 TaxID=2920324 RepID=UPI001F5AE776|nr:dTDP-4-dehydrorhamnose 3,5-epimerase [Bacillus cereus group sp. BfR-BA-01380]